jgi:RNA polymerase-binding protein DksA
MHLNPQERSGLRTQLVRIRLKAQELLERQRAVLAAQGANRAVGDGTDDVQGEAVVGTTIALTQQAARTLTQADEALRAISRDEYGICKRCGGAIALERLRALPFATLCLGCMEEGEAEDRRRRHVPVYPPT